MKIEIQILRGVKPIIETTNADGLKVAFAGRLLTPAMRRTALAALTLLCAELAGLDGGGL